MPQKRDKVDIGPLLPKVQRPGRYIGGEINQVVKNLPDGGVSFALCFPDVYEIGMSFPGLQILYTVLNGLDWCAAERCFAVWSDMEGLMRGAGAPLFTLETHRPLAAFDVVGFSLHHEMSYTQVLAMLDLAGIPLFASERGDGDPVVVGGGPCCMNPEPLAPFFDAFFLGDGEDGIVEIARTVGDWKAARGARTELLESLARIPGVYVPSFYDIDYDGLYVAGMKARPPAAVPVARRILPEIDSVPYPVRQLVPNVSPVHDRLVVEIQRGCTRGCRFCHAGIVYRPTRTRSPRRVLELSDEGLKATGHQELSLLSLSAGDYPALSLLLSELMARHGPERVSLSLPSMRVETLDPALVEEIRKVRKTGFTIAPEAGSQRLRDVINKGVTEQDLLDTVKSTFGAGWGLIKLYFMVGLPTETMEDVAQIAELVSKALRVAKSVNRQARFNVSISTFVPKAHTPFQWEGMPPAEELRSRLGFARSALQKLGVAVSIHDPVQGMIEAVLARGDRRMSAAVLAAFKGGARLEAWNENFSAGIWEAAFRAIERVEAADICGPRDVSRRLPWEHLDTGVKKEFLLEEKEKAARGERTEDCASGPCTDCGVCTAENGVKPDRPSVGPASVDTARSYSFRNEEGEQRPSVLRVRYSRRGYLAYLGHLDVMGLWIQAIRRTSLPVEYSKGFHPKAKVAFGPACPVGVESSVEYMDIELRRRVDPSRAVSLLNAFVGAGLRAEESFFVPFNAPSLSVGIKEITYRFTFGGGCDAAAIGKRIGTFMETTAFSVKRTKEGRTREFDLRASVLDARLDGGCSSDVRVANSQSGSAKLAELFEHVFGLGEAERASVGVERTAVSFE